MTTERRSCDSQSNGLKRYLVGVAVAITTRMDRVEQDVAQLTVRVHTLETER